MTKKEWRYTIHIPNQLRKKILAEKEALEGMPPFQPVSIKSIIIKRLYQSYKETK